MAMAAGSWHSRARRHLSSGGDKSVLQCAQVKWQLEQQRRQVAGDRMAHDSGSGGFANGRQHTRSRGGGFGGRKSQQVDPHRDNGP
jgi:hypothetical protein